MLNFGKYAPDLPPLLLKGEKARSPRAVNVIPGALGYLPFSGPSILTADATVARAQGGVSAIKPDGSIFTVVGDQTDLYEVSAGSLTSVQRSSGGDYDCPSDDIWRFTRHGDDLIAVNYNDDIQSFDLRSGSLFAKHVTSTLEPKARYVATVGEFLVVANVDEGGTDYPQRVRWTNINDNSDFDHTDTNQSDKQDILDSGNITGLIGEKEYGVVLTELGIHRMDYVGGDIIFTIDKIEGSFGCLMPMTAIGHRKDAFYYSTEGFTQYNGVETIPIGTERVDRFFSKDVAYHHRDRIRTAICPICKIYVVAYPGDGHDNGVPNRALVYRWDIREWALIEDISVETLFTMMAEGLTLEQLDNISSSLDALEASLDSASYGDGRPGLGGVNTDGKVVSFDGDPLTAYIDTSDVEFIPGQLARLNGVRPNITATENTVVSAKILGKNTPAINEDYVEGDYVSIEDTGEIYFINDDSYRYQRIRVKIENGFDHAVGLLDIEAQPDGDQ